MFKKIFRKVFLLAGIFLLGTFMLVQLSWGCDDHDGWDYDHHDKWSCDHHGKPCHPPKIQRVYLDYQADSIVFEIWGNNFDNGVTPVVTLGGIFDLTVNDALTDDNVITATLSSITEKTFEFGDYRLVVSTCHGSECKDKYCKDHGSNCKCKYCKDHCSKCKDKYCKDKYCKEHEYKCKCKDKYSLTIPGPSGTPGMLVPVTVSSPGNSSRDNENQYVGTALCAAGYMVTGGGFSSRNLNINESRPEGNGWYVLGTIIDQNLNTILTIHAVCAKVQ
jgi:hypothetical protein